MRALKLAALVTALLVAPVLAVPVTASAHEFIIVPEMWDAYTPGQAVPLSVYSTHYFVRSEELEEDGYTELKFQGDRLPIKANQEWLTYDSKVTLTGEGANIVAGHRLPMVYEEVLYEKFAKLILPVAGNAAGYDKILGQRLEIVPMVDPSTIQVGDEVSFQVLLDGRPAAFDTVLATYSGFSDIPGAWAFSAAPVVHGEARIKISAPGLWLVRVGVILDEKGAGYGLVDLKSVLSFPVFANK